MLSPFLFNVGSYWIGQLAIMFKFIQVWSYWFKLPLKELVYLKTKISLLFLLNLVVTELVIVYVYK